MRRWKKVFLANKSGKVGGAILVSDRTKQTVTKDKKGHYIMIKSSIQKQI